MERTLKSSKNSLTMVFIISMIIIATILSGYITYHYSEIKYWDNLIYPGIMIEGINISGYTKDEAKNIIKQKYLEQIKNKKININVDDKSYTLNYSSINPKYNTDSVIDTAYSFGKNSNIFSKYFLIKNPRNIDYKISVAYDSKPIKTLLSKMENDLNQAPVDAALSIGSPGISVIADKNGRRLQTEKLEKDILNKIDGSLGEDINLKTETQTIPAKVKKEMLASINTRIGSFSTNFGTISSPERANNIIIATKSINGKVLMPGEEFSFNNTVGKRTEARGYEAAPVIVGNKLESGLGGGICQVSTTLYNAIFDAGIPPTERTHHTMPVHYVAAGMDATVDYGNIDFKFKNILNYPIYIQAYTSGGNVIFNLYSNAAARK